MARRRRTVTWQPGHTCHRPFATFGAHPADTIGLVQACQPHSTWYAQRSATVGRGFVAIQHAVSAARGAACVVSIAAPMDAVAIQNTIMSDATFRCTTCAPTIHVCLIRVQTAVGAKFGFCEHTSANPRLLCTNLYIQGCLLPTSAATNDRHNTDPCRIDPQDERHA